MSDLRMTTICFTSGSCCSCCYRRETKYSCTLCVWNVDGTRAKTLHNLSDTSKRNLHDLLCHCCHPYHDHHPATVRARWRKCRCWFLHQTGGPLLLGHVVCVPMAVTCNRLVGDKCSHTTQSASVRRFEFIPSSHASHCNSTSAQARRLRREGSAYLTS